MTKIQNFQTEEYITEFEKEKTGLKEKFNDFLKSRYFMAVVIVLVALISFSLGRISGIGEKREPVRVIDNSPGEVKGANIDTINNYSSASAKTLNGQTTPSSAATTNPSGYVVASKNGTKYHYPWCSGAKQISEKNLVTFNSIEEARAAGYTPASNCKGLK